MSTMSKNKIKMGIILTLFFMSFNLFLSTNISSETTCLDTLLYDNNYENSFCFITGESTNTHFPSLLNLPFSVMSEIRLGYWPNNLAEGTITTIGLNGLKTISGSFYGDIDTSMPTYTGVIGFTGVKTIKEGPNQDGYGTYSFSGFALRVKLYIT